MNASSVVVKAAAGADVGSIAEYIALDSEQAAERFRSEFKDAINRIRAFPEIGHRARAPNQDLRLMRISSRFRRYLIVYRVRDDSSVSIIRVIHGAMDVRAELAKSDLS